MKDIRRMVEEALDDYITEDIVRNAIVNVLDSLDIDSTLAEALEERVSDIVVDCIADYVRGL